MTDKWKALGRDRRDKVGTPYRQQRNVYAMRVTLAITGGKYVCPCCTTPFDMTNAQSFDVDKVIPAKDYVPGNILYICRQCNATRGLLQQNGKDWRYVLVNRPDGSPGYAQLVSDASARVSIPKLGEETRAEWQAITAHRPKGSGSKYA